MNRMASSLESSSPVKSSFSSGWPSLLFAVAVAGAAVYAFSHRPPPPFAPTQVQPDRIQINGVVQAGERLVAVGELGRILVANDSKGGWHEAKVDKPRGSTLTQVLAIDGALIAVGHDGWILRSEDQGETWKEVQFVAEGGDPLLGVAGPYDGTLFAYGSFGLFLTSSDGGKTWTKSTLVEEGAAPAAAEAPPAEAAAPAADDPWADPFANVGKAESGIGDRHLNAMTRAADGSLWLVGERGLLLQSRDKGATWKDHPGVYAGSFFGMLSLPSRGLLAFGMRGNAYYSTDSGQTWNKSKIPESLSLFGGAVTSQNEIILVGASNAVFVSRDGGSNFTRMSPVNQKSLTAVLSLKSGDIVTAGEGGVELGGLNAQPKGVTP
ncbi:sialidase [Solimonas sp. K1W22B-7]|uniref:WD40/YVTN/BNR-like repeat-containing protein n=1 Tax=Solimonas sp. K1W22B-7 TaxID=2303331 RepID=UPI000E33201D|nr:sialidase [Solimonas sp. K1W22B-7]AXQ28137.1 sialidase [Solimonas sp. K1W22B-7]